MKKKIFTSDFKELSEEHREHLRDITDFYRIDSGFHWYNKILRCNDFQSSQYMIFSRSNKIVTLDTGENIKVYPCYTIGDMIEILSIKGGNPNNVFTNNDSVDSCNALWQEIKWCLEEELI